MGERTKNIILITVGYLLSPLSFWNDIFINIPLAFGFGFVFGLINQKLFFPFMIIGYWLTNIIGIILMHYGTANLISKEKKYSRKDLINNFAISIGYTIIIIILIQVGWLKFPMEYFK